MPQLISLNSDFSSATWSMRALSLGTDDIIAKSGVTIAAPDASFTPAIETYKNLTVTYNDLQLEEKYCMEQFIVNCFICN